jgi:hypothetical protein
MHSNGAAKIARAEEAITMAIRGYTNMKLRYLAGDIYPSGYAEELSLDLVRNLNVRITERANAIEATKRQNRVAAEGGF